LDEALHVLVRERKWPNGNLLISVMTDQRLSISSAFLHDKTGVLAHSYINH